MDTEEQNRAQPVSKMIIVTFDSIRTSTTDTNKRIVLLKERDGERYLPIWAGQAETDLMLLILQNTPVDKPMPHDIMKTLMSLGNLQLKYIAISNLQNEVFEAKLVIERADSTITEVSCRPSDAINLALRADVKILVAPDVMNQFAITLQPIAGVSKNTVEGSSNPESAQDKLGSALGIARQVIVHPSIAENQRKKQEILGIIENLEAAIRALSSGRDDEGRPISPTMIGAGLNNMMEYWKQNGIWFTLHVNAPDDAQQQLDTLKDKIIGAADSCK